MPVFSVKIPGFFEVKPEMTGRVAKARAAERRWEQKNEWNESTNLIQLTKFPFESVETTSTELKLVH